MGCRRSFGKRWGSRESSKRFRPGRVSRHTRGRVSSTRDVRRPFRSRTSCPKSSSEPKIRVRRLRINTLDSSASMIWRDTQSEGPSNEVRRQSDTLVLSPLPLIHRISPRLKPTRPVGSISILLLLPSVPSTLSVGLSHD